MLRIRTTFLILTALATVAVGCSDEPTNTPTETTAFGTTTALFGGNVRSFVKSDASGNPIEIGVRLSETTVNSMPAQPGAHPAEHMYVIPLPSTAAATAIQHLSLDWNARGHEPPGVYDTAHFDFHFYTVPLAERLTWSGQGEDSARMVKRPDPSLVPAGFFTDGGGIPYMGMHYVDPTSGEFAGAKFNSTFIWGYYDGKQAFIEPMITQWYLKSKTSLNQNLKLPTAYSRPGMYYPTTYSVSFDAATSEHVIALGGMVKR